MHLSMCGMHSCESVPDLQVEERGPGGNEAAELQDLQALQDQETAAQALAHALQEVLHALH